VVALPLLLEACRELHRAERDRSAWRLQLERQHDEVWAASQEEAARDADLSPVSTSRLAAETWQAVKEHDWVLTAGTASDWAPRIWDFDRPYRHPGRSLGTATQIGISLGVALAYKGTDRLVVDLQPDGDLMFDLGALWIAAYHDLPLLAVMFNNRAYYNDWEIAKPAPDFGAVARALGWHAEGPIDDPDRVGPAIRRAADVVTRERRPALVDVVCQPE
jgi:benzoylformate decarboxylase/acetolactate synthase-1/2/3 large subunit